MGPPVPPTGLVLGNDPAQSVREIAADAVRAEDAGFSMAFFSETMASNRDSVSALAAMALATRTIELGAIQVVRLRTPLMLAESIATLDELSGCRLTLALGAFTKRHALRHGLEPSKPATTLREYVEVTRRLLTGEAVHYEGEYVRMRGTALAWKPPRPDVPLWIAANSAGGLAAAARLGDGVLLDGATSPEYTRAAVALLRSEAEAAGRDPKAIRVAQLVNVSLERTRREALDAVRSEIAGRFRNPQPATAKAEIGEPHVDAGEVARYVAAFRDEGREAQERLFGDDLLGALSASGTAAEVADRLAAYREAGVDLPLMRPARHDQLDALFATLGTPR